MMRHILLLLFTLNLAACGGSDLTDLEEFVAQTAAGPRGRIPPLPEFKPYSAFIYSASALRSPFESPVLFDELASRQDNLVEPPDENRRKDALESFSLGELSYRGVLSKGDDSELVALVRTTSGQVVQTKLGDYLGKNNGKIIGISENKIDVIETVPNGSGGWISRPQTLGLHESGGF